MVRGHQSPGELSRAGHSTVVDSYVFSDPSGRLKVVYTQLGTAGPEYEVVKIMQTADAKPYFDPEKSFYVAKDSEKKSSGKEASRQCMICHALSPDGAFLTSATINFVKGQNFVTAFLHSPSKGVVSNTIPDFKALEQKTSGMGSPLRGYRPALSTEDLRKLNLLKPTEELDKIPLPNVPTF